MSVLLCALAITTTLQADKQVFFLWPNGAPGSEARKNEAETKPNPWSVGNIYNPSLTVYLPPPGSANGTSIVIAPGGGHRELVVGEEGTKPAQYFAQLGITAFVLKYRLAREANSGLTIDKDTRADTYRAMRVVRSHAKEWNLNPDRVGMIGFSAGGENLSMAAFQGGLGDAGAPDPIDRLDAKPNFAIWIYPGPIGIPEEIKPDAPPAFLLVSNDDDHISAVLDIAAKYRKVKAPMQLHVLSGGGHGFNMGDRSNLAAVKTWPQRMADWLSDRGLLKRG